MNLFDAAVAMAALLAFVGGWRLGFVVRVASWIGLGIGLFVAVRLLPRVLRLLDRASAERALLVALAVVFLGAAVGQLVGVAIGARLRPRGAGAVGALDHATGSLAGVAGMVVIVWLLLPALASAPGSIAAEVRSSATATWIDETLPPAPDSMQALRAAVGEENFPAVFDALVPAPALGPPPEASGLSEATAASVRRSVVKVEGPACGRIQDGTGFVAAPDTVVTNAHVVAGQRTTEVERDDGRRRRATVVAFDPRRDVAVLQVDDLDRPPLSMRGSEAGQSGGVFGHPGGGPLRIAPFRTVRVLEATGRDIYGTATVTREVLELNASLRPGDSGSGLVDRAGEVVGLAFAIAPDNPNVAYALSVAEVRTVLATVTPQRSPVGTGACTA